MGCVRTMWAQGCVLNLCRSSSIHLRRSPLLYLQNRIKLRFCYQGEFVTFGISNFFFFLSNSAFLSIRFVLYGSFFGASLVSLYIYWLDIVSLLPTRLLIIYLNPNLVANKLAQKVDKLRGQGFGTSKRNWVNKIWNKGGVDFVLVTIGWIFIIDNWRLCV